MTKKGDGSGPRGKKGVYDQAEKKITAPFIPEEGGIGKGKNKKGLNNSINEKHKGGNLGNGTPKEIVSKKGRRPRRENGKLLKKAQLSLAGAGKYRIGKRFALSAALLKRRVYVSEEGNGKKFILRWGKQALKKSLV